jgi:hypothetical protein
VRAETYVSFYGLVIAVLGGLLAIGALMFANVSMPGDSMRHILLFVAGFFMVTALSGLRRAIRIADITQGPQPPASSPPAPPASSASPS